MMLDIREYMQEYNRGFDEAEFDAHLWEAMQEEDFEMDEDFREFLLENGISDIHGFLKKIRMKYRQGGSKNVW